MKVVKDEEYRGINPEQSTPGGLEQPQWFERSNCGRTGGRQEFVQEAASAGNFGKRMEQITGGRQRDSGAGRVSHDAELGSTLAAAKLRQQPGLSRPRQS